MTRVVEGWQIEAELGRGAFGAVLRARRESDGIRAAIKFAEPGDRLARLQLEAEREALARVGPPTVPELLGSGELEDRTPWIALELIEQPTLEQRLRGGRLPPDAITSLGLALLEALEALHAGGYLHLDLKPANVFAQLLPARARLFDLGLSRPLLARGPSAPELLLAGTPEYMAPEQCEGRRLTVATDLYAAGAVLFELLAGRPPFVGTPGEVKQAHLGLRPPRPSRLLGHAVTSGLEDVVLRCLAKEPGRRFGSAAELRAAWAAACPPPWAPPSWPPPPGPEDLRAVAPRAPAPGPPAERRSAGLVFFSAPGSSPQAVAAEVAAAGARLASATPPRYVAVVAPERSENAVREALAVAQALCGRGLTDRAAIDVGPVAVQKRLGGSIRFVSSAFARVDHFPREGDPIGPLLTAAAAVLLPEVATVPVGRADLRRLSSAQEAGESAALDLARAPLMGRAALLEGLLGEATVSLGRSEPGISVVVADPGMGKSRLAAALVERLEAALPQAEVLELRAPEPVAGGAEGLLRLLLGRLLEDARPRGDASTTRVEPGRTASDLLQLRDRLRAHLLAIGPEAEATFTAALGLTLGLIAPDRPEVRALAAAPGAVRALQLRGVGELLRARARARPLCLVIDDAHHADDAALDALEYAALAEAQAPLWIAVLARPAFSAARPSFGERASRVRRDLLGALEPEQAAQLCRVLLEPAVNVPAEAVHRLVQRTQGVPLLLVELLRGLHREGLVQRREGGAWVLATDELERLPDLPLVEWLAERELAALAPELASYARLISLLGPEVQPEEIVGVVDDLERGGEGAAPALDARVGVRRLRSAGLLVSARDGMVRLRHSLVRDAVAKAIPAGFRLAVHRAAHRFFQSESAAPEERRLPLLALHAAESGLRDEAAGRYLSLAVRARIRHAYLEAERSCTRALELLDPGDGRRLLALHARASMRYRIGRSEDAIADFAAARALARAVDDGDALVDLLLEEATALDWRNDFVRSTELVHGARAQALLLPDRSELRSARLSLGAGRSLFRAGDWAGAERELSLSAQLAAGCGDPGYETQVIALTLLQVVLPQLDRVAETERISEQVMALCRSHGDQLHLGSAINNRRNLLVARKDLAACIADQLTFMRIGRELGMLVAEYTGEYNLGEIYYQAGDAGRAVVHTGRAVAIEERHQEVAPRPVALLLRARIHAWAGEADAARAAREKILAAVATAARERRASGALQPSEAVLSDLVDLATRDAPAVEWDQLVLRSARDSIEQEHLEVLELRAISALRGGRVAEAREALLAARAAAERTPNLFDRRLGWVEERLAAAELSAAG